MKQTADITALQERHLDIMIKLAFDLDDAEETQRLLDESEAELSAEEERLADEILVHAFQKAEEREKARKRVRRRAAVRRAMPRVALIASCLILVLTIALPIAIASSPVLRSRVMRLIVEVDEERGRADFWFVADPDAAFDVPEGWTGNYFPSYIPEGFSVWAFDPYVSMVEYRPSDDPDGYQQLFFAEMTDDSVCFAGTDGAEIHHIDIQGRDAMLIEGYGLGTYNVSITWANDTNWFYVVSYDIDTDVAIQVARSVRKIMK